MSTSSKCNVFFLNVMRQSERSVCLCQVLCSNSVLDSSEYWLKNDKALCRIGFLEDQHDGGCPTVSLSHVPHALIYTRMSIHVINIVCVTVWKSGGIYIVFSLPLINVLLIGVIMWYDGGCGWIIYAVILWTGRIHLAALTVGWDN